MRAFLYRMQSVAHADSIILYMRPVKWSIQTQHIHTNNFEPFVTMLRISVAPPPPCLRIGISAPHHAPLFQAAKGGSLNWMVLVSEPEQMRWFCCWYGTACEQYWTERDTAQVSWRFLRKKTRDLDRGFLSESCITARCATFALRVYCAKLDLPQSAWHICEKDVAYGFGAMWLESELWLMRMCRVGRDLSNLWYMPTRN